MTLLLALGCSSDAFFVRRAGADLPVWREGELDAGPTIVVQHGSGATGHVYDWMPAFDRLEQQGPVVYWDQRGAGVSQGDPADDTLRMEDSVLDLAAVLQGVRTRWAPERIVLLGHSLGGGLSQTYLTDAERAAGVVGYVDVSGGRDLARAFDLARAVLMESARRRVDDPSLTAAQQAPWLEMLAFYEDTSTFPREEPGRSTHAAHVDRHLLAEGFDHPGSTADMTRFLTRRATQETLFGDFDALAYSSNTRRFLTTYDIDGGALDLAAVGSIATPALMISGRFDLAVPTELSDDTAAGWGGPSEHVVLERSAHFPMWDEPDAFVDAVLGFLDTLP